MSVCEDIIKKRWVGKKRCGYLDQPGLTVAMVAKQYELRADAMREQLTWKRARAFMQDLLRYDLAYQSQIMSAHHTEQLTRRFFEPFTPDTVTIFSNTQPKETRDGRTWSPATDATFDAGIIIIGQNAAAVFWVEDED